MNIANITVNACKHYIRQNKNLYDSIIQLYDKDYKQYIKQNNQLLKHNRLNNRIAYDSLRTSAATFKKWKQSLFDQIGIDTIESYISKFYRYISTYHSNLEADYNDIIMALFIRDIYNPFKGYNAEVLIQQAISTSSILNVSYDSSLDKNYSVDLLISDKTDSSLSLALQIKSTTDLFNVFDNKRMTRSVDSMSRYTTNTSIPCYFVFYNSQLHIAQHETADHTTLEPLYSIDDIQQTRANKSAQFITTQQFVHYLEYIFTMARESY